MNKTIVVFGENKTGKTSFALSAPRKIGWLELDIGGLNRASSRFPDWQEYVDHKQLVIRNPLSSSILAPSSNPDKVVGMFEMFDEALASISGWLDSSEIQTIVIDPWTKMWKLVTQAFLQSKQQANPNRVQLLQIEYGKANEVMKRIMEETKKAGKNLILTQSMEDEYRNQQIGGKVESLPVLDSKGNTKRVPAGWRFDRVAAEADLILRTYTEEEGSQFTLAADVYLSGVGDGPGMIGTKFTTPTWAAIDDKIAERERMMRELEEFKKSLETPT